MSVAPPSLGAILAIVSAYTSWARVAAWSLSGSARAFRNFAIASPIAAASDRELRERGPIGGQLVQQLLVAGIELAPDRSERGGRRVDHPALAPKQRRQA